MRERAVNRIAMAVRGTSRRVVRENVKEPHRATVLAIDPFEVELTGSGLVILEDEDLMISQHLRKYHRDHGVKVGDSLHVIPVSGDEWVASDVISLKDTFEGADTTMLAPGGRVFGVGASISVPSVPTTASGYFTSTEIIGVIPFRDKDENIIGFIPVIS